MPHTPQYTISRSGAFMMLLEWLEAISENSKSYLLAAWSARCWILVLTLHNVACATISRRQIELSRVHHSRKHFSSSNHWKNEENEEVHLEEDLCSIFLNKGNENKEKTKWLIEKIQWDIQRAAIDPASKRPRAKNVCGGGGDGIGSQ